MPFKDPKAKREYHRNYMKQYFANNPDKKAAHLVRVGANNERYMQERRQWVDDYLASHPCVDCGEADRDVLDFDHVLGDKSFGISEAISRGSSLKVLIEEIAKCEVRCANCHRKVTRKRERCGVEQLGSSLGS